VTGLKLKDTQTGCRVNAGSGWPVHFHRPYAQYPDVQGQLEMDELGYITANHFMETNIPGVFVAGEVADSHFRQVITSAGMGASAAIQATHFLEKRQPMSEHLSLQKMT